MIEQALAELAHAFLGLWGRDNADEIFQSHVADLRAEAAADLLAENRFRALGCADGANEFVHSLLIGNAPANIGAGGERLIDGSLVGIAGEQLRARQIEDLQPMIQALHRLDRPRHLEVQAALGDAVVRGDRLAELRDVDVFAAVHGERGGTEQPRGALLGSGGGSRRHHSHGQRHHGQ